MEKNTTFDYRKFSRFSHPLRVKCFFMDEVKHFNSCDSTFEFISENIGYGGMKGFLPKTTSIGKRLRFSLLNDESKTWAPFLDGMVTWVSKGTAKNNLMEAGICFSPDQVNIRSIISNLDINERKIGNTLDNKKNYIEPAYDGSKVTFKLLRLFGWGPLNNLGYFKFPSPFDALNLISSFLQRKLIHLLPDAQKRLVSNVVKLLAIKPGEKLLDIACGKGFSTFLASSRYPNTYVSGVDLLNRNILAARALYGGVYNLRYDVDDAMNLHFSDSSFEKIMCIEAAFHFPSRQDFLNQVYKVLKTGGRAVIVDFMWSSSTQRPDNFDSRANLVKSEWEWDDFSSIKEYESMARSSGFKIIKWKDWSSYVTSPLEFTFLTVALLGNSVMGRKILRVINPLTTGVSALEWWELLRSAKAHNYIRKKIKYMALTLEK